MQYPQKYDPQVFLTSVKILRKPLPKVYEVASCHQVEKDLPASPTGVVQMELHLKWMKWQMPMQYFMPISAMHKTKD